MYRKTNYKTEIKKLEGIVGDCGKSDISHHKTLK